MMIVKIHGKPTELLTRNGAAILFLGRNDENWKIVIFSVKNEVTAESRILKI